MTIFLMHNAKSKIIIKFYSNFKLTISSSQDPADQLTIKLISETLSAISEIFDNKADNLQGPFYNLNGQRVSRPGKGIYIVNGKKVIFK